MQQDQAAPKKRRRTRLIILTSALTVLLAAGYTGTWFWAAERLSEGLASWRQEQQGRGYDISYGEPEVTGFPGKAGTVLREPRISAPSGWHYRGPEVTARAGPWEPSKIEVELAGRHYFARPKGQPRVIEIEVARGQSIVSLNQAGGFDRVDLDAADVTFALPQSAFEAELVRAKFGPLNGASNGELETLEFGLALAALILPEEADAIFGQKIEQLEIAATLHGHLGTGDQRQALATWRDSGGYLEVHRLAFTWGPLSAEGQGKLTLDQDFRPSGELRARFQGLEPAVEHLTRSKRIEPGQAKTARSIVKLLADPSDQGKSSVNLPLQFNQGRLFLGPLALGRLSPVL